ncbi:DUF3099 domain-containing protein [Corynebacterium heidelbergense]|uniref:DUF3099 domain-containing protein n=1 Tax=Corynebacterium heidelbergense TaxID=2055947 RepID=A0A364V642_9CORY|nr:DUF3099 domain-containing protein [Corynebacterium heidelbergense]RAV32112.1 DUF3099 domain-containing protein [Corynebacterium heidelbergense]
MPVAKPSRRARRRRGEPVELITDARRSPLENWRKRRKTYIILQLIRLPLLASTGLVLWLTHNMVLAVIIASISVPLPWIAVLLANETGDVDKQERKVYKPAVVRQNRDFFAPPHPQLGPAHNEAAQLPSGTSDQAGVHPPEGPDQPWIVDATEHQRPSTSDGEDPTHAPS